MKKILVLCMVLNLCLLLQAQPGKVTRQVTKVLVEQPAAAKGTLSHYNGARGAAMGVNYYLQHNMPKTQVTVTTTQRPWLEQQKRNWKAYRLHQARRARDLEAQIQAQERAAREAILAKLPKANPAHQFIAQNFNELIPAQIPAEELPLVAQPGVLFRGMALPTDGEAVKNILQNGLRLEDLGSHATTKLLSISGGARGAVSSVRPVTNLSSIPSEALYWATQRIEPGKELPVITVVKNQTQSGEVVLVSQDIPAEDITHVLVPVNYNGKPVWGNVELAPDGGFLVTPYDIAPETK